MNEVTVNNSELIPFEQKYLTTLVKIKELEEAKKDLEEKVKQIKEQISVAMSEYNVTSVKTSFITISKSKDSVSTTLDTARIKKEDPDLYNKLMKRYSKTVERKGSISFRL